MKKNFLLVSLCIISLCFIAGCSSKKKAAPKKSEQTITTSKKGSETKSKDSNTDKKSEQSDKNSTPVNNSSKQASAVNNNSQASPEAPPAKNDILSGYSQEYIEYARVWLAVMGADYIKYLDDPEFRFNLNVDFMPAGSPINRFDENSATYPVDTIHLSGNASFQGSVVYASNYNGTVTRYDTPSHWHYNADVANDPEALRALSQDVIDRAEIIPVPTGDPESVKRLIDTIIVH
ncbi:hypothetical protein ACWN8V_05235 [Vagococcus elongatus]|uniref:DUF4767 domain-containing protein n=1 Tax=Vagococcus elongatus TaxID=180344 RepID=A0A430AN93_9ENTE|nr:hypothetical protein [Vagococcus elongatus]RSU09559.1 hypothetical protein CBF29_11175 [Vagococcus elongatus]